MYPAVEKLTNYIRGVQSCLFEYGSIDRLPVSTMDKTYARHAKGKAYIVCAKCVDYLVRVHHESNYISTTGGGKSRTVSDKTKSERVYFDDVTTDCLTRSAHHYHRHFHGRGAGLHEEARP